MSLRDALVLYDAIVELPPARRESELSKAEPGLQHMVREMLAVNTASLRFHTGAGWHMLDADRERDRATELPKELPGFRVLGVLGRGGMGQVLDAEQLSPRRRVALKVIHPWLVTERSRAWLRDEAEALGALLHPGIPQVYSFVEVEDLSFLVMERVQGDRLDAWAKERSVRERVGVIAGVARAVAHAHGRGFLHLDLKPENVLVAEGDQPKVLDFGLSRTLDKALEGAAGGTPAYMSPEQAAGERVDLRADVYSLGVMLWQLLRDERPPMTGELAPLDRNHRRLAGELSAIVGKATKPDKHQRYSSVESMLLDLNAYLSRRPVSAYLGGPAYRLWCGVRRSPALWSLGALAVGALIAGTGVSVERAQVADEARQEALHALSVAELAKQRSEADAERALAAADFLTTVFTELNPRRTTGKTTLLAAAEVAMERLEAGELDDAPAEAVRLRVTLAKALMNRGEREAAATLAEQAVAAYGPHGLPFNAQYVEALQLQAILLRMARDRPDAQKIIDRAYAVAMDLGLELAAADLLHSQGVVRFASGEYQAAARDFEEALRRKRAVPGVQFEDLSNTMNQVGHMRYKFGDLSGAKLVFEEVLAGAKREHALATAAVAHHWLAQVSLDMGEPSPALQHLGKAVSIRDGLNIESSSRSRHSELILRSAILLALDDVAGARAAMDRYLAAKSEDYVVVRHDAAILEEILVREGRVDEARALVARAYDYDVQAPEGSGSWAWAFTTRGLWRARVGAEGAEDDLRTALSVWKPRFGAKNRRVHKLQVALDGLP